MVPLDPWYAYQYSGFGSQYPYAAKFLTHYFATSPRVFSSSLKLSIFAFEIFPQPKHIDFLNEKYVQSKSFILLNLFSIIIDFN